jgi:hypothetical protein
MFQCKIKFQFVPLHIGYNFQHFELNEYVNKLYSYGQYKMHGSVINVVADQTQSILSCLSLDEATICVFLK